MSQPTSSPTVALNLPDAVVQDYLDFMLRSVTETVVLPNAGASPAREELRTEPLATPATLTRPVPAEQARAMPTPSRATHTPADATVNAPQPRAANGRPLWAQEPFECLLFQVLGLKLAAPLIALGGIARIAEDLTPIFGQSDWFMGLLRWNGRNIRVVDTARLIMPERLPTFSEGQKPAYEFVLLIEGTDWGLAMDSATESLHMTPDEVRWRVSAQTRPWLAGTVLQKMCALLDMNAIALLLHSEQLPEQEI
ncbi:MAG: chemotaxis protein CheW [Gammaproteobacteria bacterium]|nr:chemotaxis protein CheW [Gammaproteobacteria bacterium]